MWPDFLLYGSTGYTGQGIARLAVEQGLRPLLAGRNAARLQAQADELGLEYRAFELSDAAGLEAALEQTALVLHCAGPYLNTFKPVVEACLRTQRHYLDLTGEIAVFQAVAARDAEAKEQGVMLLPGAGLEIVATDCLAAHLKGQLPSATHLALGFMTEGPAGPPPGTFKSLMEFLPEGDRVRRDGQLIHARGLASRTIDFGCGPMHAIRMPWPDVFTAYYSTGIPNIEGYAAWPAYAVRQRRMIHLFRSLFKLRFISQLAMRSAPPGPTAKQRASTCTRVWGEVTDARGNQAVARLHGPEGGLTWTGLAALEVVKKLLAGDFKPGFMTPALAYGPDLVMGCKGARREDVN